MIAPAGLPNRRTRIKMCGFTREQDIDAAVAAGADAIGFVLYEKSPRYVSAPRAAELAQRLPPFVTPVLLFVNESTTKIIATCAMVTGATAQFHGEESSQECQAACTPGQRPWLRAARIPGQWNGQNFDLLKFVQDYSRAQGILLDAHSDAYGGSGQTFDWSLIPNNLNAHLILSGGLNATNVTDGIVWVRPRCQTLSVDVSSGIEVQGCKGIKDAEKMAQFVAAVRTADQQHPV